MTGCSHGNATACYECARHARIIAIGYLYAPEQAAKLAHENLLLKARTIELEAELEKATNLIATMGKIADAALKLEGE